MVWGKLQRILGRQRDSRPDLPEVGWLSTEDNSWGVPVLDIRPVTLTLVSTSGDPTCASNALSFFQDDGTSFIGEAPTVERTIETQLRFPIDRLLADGALFVPWAMEDKWALFHQRGEIHFVRSWRRKVEVIASAEHRPDHIDITQVRGTFSGVDEEPGMTVRVLDYVLRTHALNAVYPAPFPAGLENDPPAAAMWCMSMFGRRAPFATAHPFERREPVQRLRANSSLHMAVARGDAMEIDRALTAGLPIDLLDAKGFGPLHLAAIRDDLAIVALLVARGSPVDLRSSSGATPLMLAVETASVDRVLWLLDHGADVNASDIRGFTPLHRAAELGLLDLARVLIDRGASPEADARGHTPMALAQRRGHAEIVAMLDRQRDRM